MDVLAYLTKRVGRGRVLRTKPTLTPQENIPAQKENPELPMMSKSACDI